MGWPELQRFSTVTNDSKRQQASQEPKVRNSTSFAEDPTEELACHPVPCMTVMRTVMPPWTWQLPLEWDALPAMLVAGLSQDGYQQP